MTGAGRRPSFWSLVPRITDGWRWVVGFAVCLGLLMLAPSISDRLDARGLPGGPIALATVTCVIGLTLWAFWTTVPRTRRRRAMARWARERGVQFRSDFTLPASMSEIPSLSALQLEGGVANLVVIRLPEDEVMVFDRWRAATPGYEDAEWRTVAVTRTHLDVPRVVIHPRHHRFRPAESETDLHPVGTESSEFEDRYRVVAGDRAAAVAVVDARTMAWLLDRPDDLTFETAGPWVACSTPSASTNELDALVEAVARFRDRLPRVLGSFFPTPDPGLGLN
jgi:hypothetical protein